MVQEKICIKEVKDDVNYFLYNSLNFGIKELQLSNQILNMIERAANEINNSIDNI